MEEGFTGKEKGLRVNQNTPVLPTPDNPLVRVPVQQFVDSGLVWLANTFLHVFGYAIAYDVDDKGNVSDLYPCRTVFRGYSEDLSSDGYERVSRYMLMHAKRLLAEAVEDEDLTSE